MVSRLGMGLEFALPIPEEQFVILNEWIEEAVASSKPLPSSFGVSAPR
jgi:hypothetical protein